jgi:Fic family protein
VGKGVPRGAVGGIVTRLHLRRDLYQFTGVPAGRWKTVENSIEEVRPDGSRFVRFRTVPASETPAAMDELHERFAAASRSGDYHPLMLVGCYVFDFLAIHPFRDGNGRMGRCCCSTRPATRSGAT